MRSRVVSVIERKPERGRRLRKQHPLEKFGYRGEELEELLWASPEISGMVFAGD